MKTLVLTATTYDGVVLDMETIEVPDDTVAIEYKPINTTIPRRGDMDTLNLGSEWK